MATKKKTTKAKPAAKKKAAPKKAVAKKSPAPKAKAAPAPKVAPAPKRKYRTMTLLTNAGQMDVRFVDDSTFEAALNIVKGAPESGGGSRTPPPLRTITGNNGSFSFRIVNKYSVYEH